MKKAVSMPCTEEQWLNEVKPLCDKYGLKYVDITNFNEAGFITNNYTMDSLITNFAKKSLVEHNGDLIPYNPIEFIKACGVEVGEPKWEKLTRGGYEYKIVMEDRGDAFSPMIIIVKTGKIWFVKYLKKNGKLDDDMTESDYDLIPYNPRKTELLTKKAELEKQLEEINKELKL